MKTKFTLAVSLVISLFLNGCIENDVDYPYVGGIIMEFQVEGMSGTSTINKASQTVELTIADDVDIENLAVTRILLENEASIFPDAQKAKDAGNFPKEQFSSLDNLPEGANTLVNFSTPVNFLIQTYQDYNWTVTVNQEFDTDVTFEGIPVMQAPVVDYENKILYAFVPEGTDLTQMVIEELQFKSYVETVSPEPFEVTNFSKENKFTVTYFGREEIWTLYVLTLTDVEPDIMIYPRTRQAIVTGNYSSGSTVTIEYKRTSGSTWTELKESSYTFERNSFSAMITGLTENARYNLRVTINGEEVDNADFRTAVKEDLRNGSFDEWYQNAKGVWYPNSLNGVGYWGTGNPAVSILSSSNSNTTPSRDTKTGNGYAAELKSVYVSGLKFAAGNIFAGYFVDVDGTNGILSFGRPFVSYPTKIRFDYKYNPERINRCNDSDESPMKRTLEAMIGEPDSCHIYWALADWDEPFEIRTKYSDRNLIDINDPNIIAYGEFVSSEAVAEYKTVELDFAYRNYRTPKYLMIVATSSKWGDYFTGGEGSTLLLDEMELIYD